MQDSWDSGSTEQRAALARLRGHADAEGDMVDAYRRLADSAPDEVVEHLARMIYDDEVRHHELLAGMLARLEAQVRWERDTSSLPDGRRDPGPPALRHELSRLLEAEKADATHLRHLRHDLRRLPANEFLTLMVDLMLLDTTKHVRILEHLRARTKAKRHRTVRTC
jgi:rubrerythrin